MQAELQDSQLCLEPSSIIAHDQSLQLNQDLSPTLPIEQTQLPVLKSQKRPSFLPQMNRTSNNNDRSILDKLEFSIKKRRIFRDNASKNQAKTLPHKLSQKVVQATDRAGDNSTKKEGQKFPVGLLRRAALSPFVKGQSSKPLIKKTSEPNPREIKMQKRHNVFLEKEGYFDNCLSDTSIEEFRLKSHIGKGCFSIVSQAVDRKTNTSYAVKTYNKVTDLDWYRLEGIKKEIKNLSKIDHQNVVGLKHVIKDKRKILLVMDYAGKQSLAGLLRKYTKLPETTCKYYFKQILQAIQHCHQKQICHRDLKPENILIDSQDKIKIIDFGFSANARIKLNNPCGTPPFMAPEITKKINYLGESADIWSLGIILYLMIYGKFPFRASNEQQLFRLIQHGKYHIGQELSPQVKDLLSKMLKVNPQERQTAQSLLKASWFK